MIPLIAVLFAGVVWLNSAKLAITKQQGQVARDTVGVGEELSILKSQQAQFDGHVIKEFEADGKPEMTKGDINIVEKRASESS